MVGRFGWMATSNLDADSPRATIHSHRRYPRMTLLVTALVLLVIVGLVVWLMDRSPFDPMIRWLVIAIAVVLAIFVLATRSGLA